jgi:hypothetical protein
MLFESNDFQAVKIWVWCCFKLNLTFLGIAVGEGQVVCFLLASSGILYLRTSLQGGSNVPKVCPLFHRRYLQFATSVFVSESLDATNMMSF